jgi:BASS family bile acid:Na+ symporter
VSEKATFIQNSMDWKVGVGMAAWHAHRAMKITVFIISRLMPVWIILCAVTAFQFHSLFFGLKDFVAPGIGCVMFFMGISFDLARLTMLIKHPWPLVLGCAGKWFLAPVISVLVAVLFFGTHSPIASGTTMAGIVPSGTSANLNSLVGGGDVTYSVSMSAIDTFIAPFLTPLIAKLCVGTEVHLGYVPFVWQMLRMAFFPLLLGIILQLIFPKVKGYLEPFTSTLSALALYGVVFGIVSGAADVLIHHFLIIPLIGCAVVLQVGAQMIVGYLYGKVLRMDERSCRSLMFEVGICNSALAAVLSNEFFGSLAATAAIANMVCNLTMGSLVAALMRKDACESMNSVTRSV